MLSWLLPGTVGFPAGSSGSGAEVALSLESHPTEARSTPLRLAAYASGPDES